jgi:hypothetical protein
MSSTGKGWQILRLSDGCEALADVGGVSCGRHEWLSPRGMTSLVFTVFVVFLDAVSLYILNLDNEPNEIHTYISS